MRRVSAGEYTTLDGRFIVRRRKDEGYRVMWDIEERPSDGGRMWTGFDTLRQARQWLELLRHE